MATKEPQPYINIPFLPLEEVDGTDRFGAQFFSNVKQMMVGFGDKGFRVDREGMWAGAEAFADAPWSVDWEGNMIANSIVLTGYIPVGGALSDIGAGNITNTYIGANAIATGNIQAGAITASKISVSSLSAISANIGSITAGSLSAVSITGSTITGTTLTTATSGQRVVLTSTFASYYNSSGTNIVNTLASSNSYIIQGQTSTSNIYLDVGTSGAVAFLENGTIRVVYDAVNNIFAPFTNGFIDLGAAGANWGDFYHNGEEVYQGMTQPVIYFGTISGTSILDDNNVPWSVSQPATGRYTITHNFGHDNYAVQVVPIASAVKNISCQSVGTNSFSVRIANLSDTLEDNDFFFTVFEYPQ